MYDPSVPMPLGLAAVLGRLSLGRDEPAWQMLLAQIGPDLLRLARRLTGNTALADDVVQEALLQIRDHAGRFSPRTADPDADARRWLLRVTANTALQLLRSSRRRTDRHRRAVQEAPVMSSTAPDAGILHDETATQLRKALATLTEPARSAVVLHHCAGLGYEQIAAELGVPIGTAKTHVHRGLERLRQHMIRLGSTLSLSALVSALDGLSASEGSIASLASHSALIHSSHHASILALPTSGVLSMATIVAGSIAAVLATAVTIGFVRGADAPAPVAPAPFIRGAGTPAPVMLAPAAPAVAVHDFTKQLDQEITLDFQDTDLVDIMSFMRMVSGLNVVVDPVLAEQSLPVTLKVEKMALRHVLSYIGKLTNVAIVIDHGALYCRPEIANDAGFSDSVVAAIAPAPGPLDKALDQGLTLDLQDAAVEDSIEFLRRVSGLEIILVPTVNGLANPITLEVSDMQLRDVLYWIGKLSHYTFVNDGECIVGTSTDGGEF